MDLETVLKNNIVGTSQQVAERLNDLVEAGADYFIIYLRNRLARWTPCACRGRGYPSS
jgi:alkanesulfonate monooxygenase SsuD/methylene tetrahydromethanopterin reductase-like flavin-dependent oxidoreductase (luciferase family)